MTDNKVSIQIVLVLYKIKIEDSQSYKTLCEHISVLSCKHELLIYNNSSEFEIETNNNYVVINAKQNEMLAVAYNFALQRAIKYNHNWLLLLDQDTCLSEKYFEQINLALNSNKNFAAIIPKLHSGEVHLSPKSCSTLFGPWWMMNEIHKTGVIKDKIVQALNSATLISTSSLQKIGGFSLEFPLYGLDYWIFFQLSKRKEQFYLMDVALSHDLSMLDYKNKMTKDRYSSIINAEYKFSKLIGLLAVLSFKVRLLFRLLRHLFTKDKRPYIVITFKHLLKI